MPLLYVRFSFARYTIRLQCIRLNVSTARRRLCVDYGKTTFRVVLQNESSGFIPFQLNKLHQAKEPFVLFGLKQNVAIVTIDR